MAVHTPLYTANNLNLFTNQLISPIMQQPGVITVLLSYQERAIERHHETSAAGFNFVSVWTFYADLVWVPA